MKWTLTIFLLLLLLTFAEYAFSDENIDISMIQHGPRLTEVIVHFEHNVDKSVMIENNKLEDPETFNKIQALVKEFENENH